MVPQPAQMWQQPIGTVPNVPLSQVAANNVNYGNQIQMGQAFIEQQDFAIPNE